MQMSKITAVAELVEGVIAPLNKCHIAPENVRSDTDVIDDRAELPALKYHVKQGPSHAQMLTLFSVLRQFKLIAVSVSAWHEEEDLDNKTAIACLNLLKELE